MIHKTIVRLLSDGCFLNLYFIHFLCSDNVNLLGYKHGRYFLCPFSNTQRWLVFHVFEPQKMADIVYQHAQNI